MVNIEHVSFPVTLEAFTALQVAEIRREPTATELELFQDVVNMANEAFQAAAQGDAETVQALLDTINHVPPLDEDTRHVAALCRGWVLLGCNRGMEILKAAIDGTTYS